MISREEVAKKWREAGERLDKEAPSDLTAAAYTTLFEFLESAGIREGNSYSDVFNRLADLIDPTCKPHVTSEILTESLTKYTAECSACGAIFGDFPTMEQAKTTHPVYCPSCGARVVRDNHA